MVDGTTNRREGRPPTRVHSAPPQPLATPSPADAEPETRALKSAAILIVGEDGLADAATYLRRGMLVVVAPNREAATGWQLPHSAEEDGEVVRVCDVEIDLSSRRANSHGTPLPLTELELKVTAALARRFGRALSFSELRSEGWGGGQAVATDSVCVRAVIRRVRSKLRSVGSHFVIVAVRGYGYRAEEGRAGQLA
jgi:DNA-binding response OmpR family regulator